MNVVKKCYINIDKNEDACCIVSLPNASEGEIINWFKECFIKDYKLYIRDFDKHFHFHWEDTWDEKFITHLATDKYFVLTKRDDKEIGGLSYFIQEKISKSELLMAMFELGINHEKFSIGGADDYAQWLFDEI